MNQDEVMFAGFGGQGVLLAAKILAYAAMEQKFEVMWVPAYGPEMRGGTAYCTVIIADRPIGSPVIKHPGHLLAMNQPSLEKFEPLVRPGGVVLINSSLIKHGLGRADLDEIMVPANDIARELGNARSANIVALGAFVARSGIVDWALLMNSVKKEFAKKAGLADLNLEAIEQGRRASVKQV